MPASVHVPKKIDTELIRQRLGDARFEKLALEVFGPMLIAPRVPSEQYAKVRAVLKGELNGHNSLAIPLVFRAFFFDHPRQRKMFEAWLDEKLAEANGRGGELNGSEMRLNGSEMRQIKATAKARVSGRKRGRPKGSPNRAKVAR